MATRSGKNFRGRMTDYQRDVLLLKILEQLESMDARLTKVEGHRKASATKNVDKEDTVVQDTNTSDKEETDHQKEGGDDSTFDYGIYDPSDLDEDLDTSFCSVVRHNLAPPTTQASSAPAVSSSAIERLKLQVQPHPQGRNHTRQNLSFLEDHGYLIKMCTIV